MTKDKEQPPKVKEAIWDFFEEVPLNWPRPQKAQHRTIGGKGAVGRLMPDKKRRKGEP